MGRVKRLRPYRKVGNLASCTGRGVLIALPIAPRGRVFAGGSWQDQEIGMIPFMLGFSILANSPSLVARLEYRTTLPYRTGNVTPVPPGRQRE